MLFPLSRLYAPSPLSLLTAAFPQILLDHLFLRPYDLINPSSYYTLFFSSWHLTQLQSHNSSLDKFNECFPYSCVSSKRAEPGLFLYSALCPVLTTVPGMWFDTFNKNLYPSSIKASSSVRAARQTFPCWLCRGWREGGARTRKKGTTLPVPTPIPTPGTSLFWRRARKKRWELPG